jgi:tetratricopeptide (TPR) repeat protein
MTATDAACVVQKIAELPVTMSGLTPTVPVKINDKDSWLIADSGAFRSILSPGTASQLGLSLQPLPGNRIVRGYNGAVKMSLVTIKKLVIAGKTLANVEFIVGGSEFGAAGMLGQDILGMADVEYDLPDGVIRLMRARDCNGTNLAYWANGKPYSVLAIDAAGWGSHITGTIELNGTKVRATFDTGAPGSILSLAAARRLGMRPGGPGVVEGDDIGGGGSGVVKTWIAPFDSLKIGDNETIQKIRLRVGDSDAGIDMLIGADFFLSHRIYVANRQRKMFVTYAGGPVFNLSVDGPATASTALPKPTGPEPTDADSFSRRAAVAATRRDYASAIADFTRANALAPNDARYLYQRAQAYSGSKQPVLAMADVDKALAITPSDVDMLLFRVQLHLDGGDLAKATEPVAADLQAADRAAASQADSRLAIATGYITLIQESGKADVYDPALSQLDYWLKYHPDDFRFPEALNARCWLRAITGRDLDRGLADCDRSLRIRANVADTLDSRGLVQLRLGALDRAIADFDAAIRVRPKTPTSLYGRGLAKQRKGDATGGKADLAAALAMEPKVAGWFRNFGVMPATTATTTATK